MHTCLTRPIPVRVLSRLILPALLLAGCATSATDPSQIAKRRAERRRLLYSLTQKELVDANKDPGGEW